MGILSAVKRQEVESTEAPDDEFGEQDLLNAEWVTGVPLDEADRKSLVDSIKKTMSEIEKLREVPLDENDPMALAFTPAATNARPHALFPQSSVGLPVPTAPVQRPDDESLAFLPIEELSRLLQSRQVTSVELTQLYLNRLKRFDPLLKCVVNLTEDLALQQAEAADREIAAGRYRGRLHGIPWGAKDLISVRHYPATWGVPSRKDTKPERDATIVGKLERAGAVLVAKLSLGALAMGDQWFGGRTNNPWNPRRGSSGSSAGSAAAVTAGLCGFAIGSETLGSIVSPSRRCGTTSLRPTFGRISRAGCMPLSWSMDKLGPMARSVADLAIVFAAIHGADQADPCSRNEDFHWPQSMNLRQITVGMSRRELERSDSPVVGALKQLGARVVAVDLPANELVGTLLNTIDIEAAAMFDQPLRENQTEGWNQWPSIFRAAHFISAVDYVRMQRMRSRLMREFEQTMQQVDFLVDADDLLITNLTGHPSVVLPVSIETDDRDQFRVRTCVATGQLYDDSRLLTFARELEQAFQANTMRPPMERWLVEANEAQEDANENQGDE
jgi:Asp-tRNA(Asn)/Glu-tRNA(Gln) amidotransferase A subunit family amidase